MEETALRGYDWVSVQKMNKEAEITEVFELLWDILSLYEESDCYNYLPGTKDNEGAWEYFDGLILNVRKKANSLFLGERDSEEYRKLNTIIDETEKFVKCFELPGVVIRWREINPRLNYYDPVFNMVEELSPEVWRRLRYMFGYRPTQWDLQMRERYFSGMESDWDSAARAYFRESCWTRWKNCFTMIFLRRIRLRGCAGALFFGMMGGIMKMTRTR